MKTKPIEEILIENRQRRNFNEEKLADLATSIRQKGLLHPIVLRDDEQTLVAGERRLRAIRLLQELSVTFDCDGIGVPLGHIPYICISALKPEDLMEAELEENLLRENLSWQEEADAIAKLHALRLGQKGKQTYTDTALEISGDTATNFDKTKVRDSIILQQHMKDPEVSKAKSAKEAMKIVVKKTRDELTRQLAEQFNIEDTPHLIHLGDFRDFTYLIDTSSIDVICTDPPYGIDADNFGSQAAAVHGYEDSEEYFKEIMQAFFLEANRVSKDRAHMYLFHHPSQWNYLRAELERFGWDVWSVPIIWDKGNGMLPKPDYGPRRTYENILFANKGNRTVTAVYPDVISIPGISVPRFGAEKPADLYTNLLRRSCLPGNTVWDPFAGTGPILPAANQVKARVYASELIPEKFNVAKLRLKD